MSLLQTAEAVMAPLNQSTLGEFMASQNLHLLGPEAIVLMALLFTLCLGFSRNPADQQRSWILPFVASVLGVITLLVNGVLFYADGGTTATTTSVLYNMAQVDSLAWLVRLLMLASFGLLILMSKATIAKHNATSSAEVYMLMLTALFGGLLLTSATDMVMVFVALETLGISSYVMAGVLRGVATSAEASLKYLVFGGVSSALLLFGLSILYGLNGGSTALATLPNVIASAPPELLPLLPYVLVLVLVSVGFKLSLAPFHAWAPDVYEGSPTPVTAFLAIISKLAGFAFAINMLLPFLTPATGPVLQLALMLMAVASMLVGNLLALKQTSIKRLLAYSSVAHVGYLAMALIVFSPAPVAALWFYLMTYAAMSLGAFGSLLAVQGELGSDKLPAWAGLATKRPWHVAAMTLSLLSLAGIPITAGFFSKFILFQTLIATNPAMTVLVLLALLASVVGLAYYVNVIRVMVLEPASPEVEALPATAGFKLNLTWQGAALTVSVAATVLLGFFAQPLMEVSLQAVSKQAAVVASPWLAMLK
jgi:proton-translocating NADH-quinone oxidoreductase chain N